MNGKVPLKAIELAIYNKGRHDISETDMEAVREVQNRQDWKVRRGAFGDYIVQANGFDVAGTYELLNAQAIVANAIDRQILLTKVDNLIEQNKRLESIVRSYLKASTVNTSPDAHKI